MSEIINSVKKAMEDRLKSPLAGAFLISWIYYNWKFIYMTIVVDIKGTSFTQQTGVCRKPIFKSKLLFNLPNDFCNRNSFNFPTPNFYK